MANLVLSWDPAWDSFSSLSFRTDSAFCLLYFHMSVLSFNPFCSSSATTLHTCCTLLRGAWRDHCFPEPFSWFLHETGLESMKIISARCFRFKCRRKDSKKAKEHRQFRGVFGRWRTAPIDRTTFHACQRCRKNDVLAVFFSASGCHLARKSLSWTAMPVSNKKQEFEQRKRIKLFDDFWVRAYRFDFAPRRRPRARSM